MKELFIIKNLSEQITVDSLLNCLVGKLNRLRCCSASFQGLEAFFLNTSQFSMPVYKVSTEEITIQQ